MTNPDHRPPTPGPAERRNAAASTGEPPGDPEANSRETETRDPKPPKVGGLGAQSTASGLHSEGGDSGGGSDTGGNTEPKTGLGATPTAVVGPPDPDPDPKPPKHGLGADSIERPPEIKSGRRGDAEDDGGEVSYR